MSDGRTTIAGNKIVLSDVSIAHLILPGGSSYMVKLNNAQIRSGEIHAGDTVIVGMLLASP